MAVTQSLLFSRPPFKGEPGKIVIRLTWSGTYAGHVIDLEDLAIPFLRPEEFANLIIPRIGGAADGKDFSLQNTLTVSGVTTANPGVVTTAEPHNLTTGDAVVIASVGGATQANATTVATVVDATKFSIPINVTGSYTSGGTVTVTPAMDWVGVGRLYLRGTSTQASSTVATTVDLEIGWRPEPRI